MNVSEIKNWMKVGLTPELLDWKECEFTTRSPAQYTYDAQHPMNQSK